MTREKSPAEEHPPEDPLHIAMDGRARLELFVNPGGVATGGSRTPPTILQWTIRVQGKEYEGWQVAPDETEPDVLSNARKWWATNQEALGL